MIDALTLASAQTNPAPAIIFWGFVIAVIILAVVRSRRPCPRCGVRVKNRVMDCPNCGFDFRTIGQDSQNERGGVDEG